MISIILTPSGDGIIPGIKLVNDAGIPIIEANNKAGFGRSEVNVVTYVGADDVDFGRLQGKLSTRPSAAKRPRSPMSWGSQAVPSGLARQGMGRVPRQESAVRGSRKGRPTISTAQRRSLSFRISSAGSLRDSSTRSSCRARRQRRRRFRRSRNGRDEIKFIVGDYPADIRQLIHDGKIFGTVDQDPYPQAYNAMHMAWLHFNGKDAEIPKPYFLPLAAGHQGERREDARCLGVLSWVIVGSTLVDSPSTASASASRTSHRRMHEVP